MRPNACRTHLPASPSRSHVSAPGLASSRFHVSSSGLASSRFHVSSSGLATSCNPVVGAVSSGASCIPGLYTASRGLPASRKPPAGTCARYRKDFSAALVKMRACCVCALTRLFSSADYVLPVSPVLNSVVLSPRLAPVSPVLTVQRAPSPSVAVIQPGSPGLMPLTALAATAQNNYFAGPQAVIPPPLQDPYINDDLLMHPILSHNNVSDPRLSHLQCRVALPLLCICHLLWSSRRLTDCAICIRGIHRCRMTSRCKMACTCLLSAFPPSHPRILWALQRCLY